MSTSSLIKALRSWDFVLKADGSLEGLAVRSDMTGFSFYFSNPWMHWSRRAWWSWSCSLQALQHTGETLR